MYLRTGNFFLVGGQGDRTYLYAFGPKKVAFSETPRPRAKKGAVEVEPRRRPLGALSHEQRAARCIVLLNWLHRCHGSEISRIRVEIHF